ncbi:hybrid sensor histidine kinase/response regulator [Curvivirga aplysinae]|uniref:hybrid sensor histidine kinase/response regulator n=1 Tax=Curvivirga aplysinae TaxID=2529852 RepID=UPI001C3FCD03|nr:GAF domain-containing hybrid sensor histidine kinase/response regulator [Curvivirga aplysinae]
MASENSTEQNRLNALHKYQVLDTPHEQAFDRLTELASSFYQSPIALISLVDSERQWFKSRVGIDAEETPREIAFCHHAIKNDDTFIVQNASTDSRFAENPLVTGDPNIRFYAGAPLKTPDGYNIGTLCIIDSKPHPEFQNTDAKQLELLASIVVSELELRIKNKNLKKVNRELEIAEKARSRFLSMLSHEIRTPLTGVIGLSEALSDFELHDEAREIVDGIHSSSQILQSLLNDVLDFAKLEAGKIKIHHNNLQLDKFARAVSKPWQLIAIDKGLDFILELQEDLPDTLFIDELRLSQVINNLLSNAIKFTSEGKIKLEISQTREYLDGLPSIEITVSDTGCGMTSEQQEKLFKPFEQTDSSITREYGGTGLGLAISKTLVELLDGRLSSESKVSEGSRFKILLPIPNSAPPPQQETDSQTKAIDSLKILIVDDIKINRDIARHIVQKLGAKCDEASDGSQAVSLVRENDYDIILMDVHMPQLSGNEAAKQIETFKPDQKIVFLSADDDINNDSQHLYLTKPLSLDKLNMVLNHKS